MGSKGYIALIMGCERQILRVFPRRTAATPTDDLVAIGGPGLFDPPDCDEVHISVTFTWHVEESYRIAKEWLAVHPCVSIGGPALGDRGGEFVPGRYLRKGHVITSRGCPNACWFCDVPTREGPIRELPIRDGWKIHDSNLLACSDTHIDAVFEMLARQPHKAEFLGGLEAARLEQWHVDRLCVLKPRRVFFAYDTPEDLIALQRAGELLRDTVVREKYCYVLMGWSEDTIEAANRRCEEACEAGFMPFAMLYRTRRGDYNRHWRAFQREWCRPQIVRSKMRKALESADHACVVQRSGK